MPLFALALAWLLDRLAGPWGTWWIDSAHLVLAVALAVLLVLDGRRLRRFDKHIDSWHIDSVD